MTMNSQGRQTKGDGASVDVVTFTGNRALQIEESLIFEKDAFAETGVDFPQAAGRHDRLGDMKREAAFNLPGLSEP